MVEFPQRLDLPELYALVPVRVLLFHFLNCHDLASLRIRCLVHCTKCAIPECLYGLVLLHPALNL